MDSNSATDSRLSAGVDSLCSLENWIILWQLVPVAIGANIPLKRETIRKEREFSSSLAQLR